MSLIRMKSSIAAQRSLCAILIAVALSGCATHRADTMRTGSIPSFSKPVSEMNSVELAQAADRIGRDYETNPRNKQAGINYATLLHMTGKDDQALAVMQKVTILNPTDSEVLAAYGKAQAAAGQLEQALASIGRAQTADRPDWRLKSAEGAILDQLGRPDEARARYREALDLAPGEPSVYSNIGISYMLSKDLVSAEKYLRLAAEKPNADSRVRQNLALAVGLQGRFDEAEQIASHELSPEQAKANIQYLRSMMSQQNAWKQLSAEGKSETGTN
jgi:Flp pilus assembly protein TadD